MTEHVLTIDLGTSGPKVAVLAGDYVDGDFTPVELKLLLTARQSPTRGGAGSSAQALRRG